MSTQEYTYLILYGAPSRPTRTVIHIAHERDGEVVPRCNTHLTSTQDRQPRQFRPAEGDELSYRVCKRCTNPQYTAWQERGRPR
jgi:hypothetical protein